MTLDELLHVLGAIAFALVVLLLPWGIGVALGNAALWFLREAAQNGWAAQDWSWHVHREWLWPSGAGAAIWLIWVVL